MKKPKYFVQDLIYLMSRLRDPENGCPWDLKQNYLSIVPSTLEEVYEVVDAIERNDMDNLKEELGDLLFQVVFYSQMANEDQHFGFEDVAHGITEKLVRRHPHVFPTGELYVDEQSQVVLSDEALHAQWERIKQEEKSHKGSAQYLLDDVPAAMPALQRAYKMQKKLAQVGFDWAESAEVFPIVEQELQECRQAVESTNQAHIEEELGDLLFATVNLCRHLKVDPEMALRGANRKVAKRFAFVEDQLREQDKGAAQASLEEMEALWQKAKQFSH